jgi:hypothetical protein
MITGKCRAIEMTNDRSLVFVASHRRPRRGPLRSIQYAAGRIRSSLGLGFTVERPTIRLGRPDEAR